MKSYSVFVLVLVWMVGSMLWGPFRAEAQAAQRISVPEAERLIAGWVKVHRPHDGATWHSRPHLKELTPQELWDRAKAQVFKQRDYTESIEEVDAYLIQGMKICPLSVGFGGNGLDSLCVCDLNHDSKPELAYTFSWGSGIHRTHLGVIRLDSGVPIPVNAEYVMTGDMRVERQSDQTVKVFSATLAFTNRGSSNRVPEVKTTLLGKLKLVPKNHQTTIDIQFDPALPTKWRKQIGKGERFF